MSKVEGCAECEIPHETCLECNRCVANEHDAGIHAEGECSCEEARSLCWKTWNDGKCESLSPYDRDYKEA